MSSPRILSSAVVFAALSFLPACGVESADPTTEDQLGTTEGAVQAAASTGWSWQYSAIIGSETYRLLKSGNLRGSCTAKSSAVITLHDNSADGLGQRVYWRVQGGAWHICDNEGGSGSTKNCSVTNNRWIQYQFCMKDGNTVVACAPEDGFQT